MQPLKKRVTPLPLAVVALAATLAAALGGCSSGGGPATDGPLSSGVDGRIPRGEICVPGGQPQTFGLEQFTNHGRATVVLDSVALQHPHNERLIGSYAVPGDLVIGAPGDWPPKYVGLPSTWKHRQPVHGFRLAPGKSFNMVLGVTATGTGRATSRGMLAYYHYSAGSYVATDDIAMTIAATKHGCN
jgi:hypothetical protein